MYVLRCVLVLGVVCVACAGCAGNTSELTARIERLEAENTKLNAELATAKQRIDRYETIEVGYEAARKKLQASLGQLAALGITESPLPPFDSLHNSDWVAKLVPSAEMTTGFKELQSQLKGLLGNEAKPAAGQR